MKAKNAFKCNKLQAAESRRKRSFIECVSGKPDIISKKPPTNTIY